jgi:Cu/Ag efflux pump CusA
MEDLRLTMKGIPGTFSAMSGPLADRVGHMLSGVSAKIAVKIYGNDLDELRSLGTEVAEIARGIPGLEEARIEQQAPVAQVRIEIDRERALAYGVRPGELNEELSALIGGEPVAEIYENQRIYDLVVRLPEELRLTPDNLGELYIDTIEGYQVPLNYVANLRQASGPNTILRENTRRRFVVAINPTVSDLNSAVEELQKQIKEKLDLPKGYKLAFEGEYQAQAAAKQRILIMSVVILLIVTFLLFSYFKSAAFVMLVLVDIPFSLIGGIIMTKYTLNTVSIATLVGFIAISGISARNSIMMISHYLYLMKNEGETFSREMIERATKERLVPVLMTALSAGIALIPLVLAADEPGKEILNPVAVVIVGGLISSTLLGLAVTPSLFYWYGRKSAEKSVRLNAPAAE